MITFILGFLDVLAPDIYAINSWLMAFIPNLFILALWSLFISVVSLYLYKKFSPQKKIVAIDENIKRLQSTLHLFETPDEHQLPLMGQYLALSFKRVGIVLIPTIISTIPILFLLSGLAMTYDSVEIIPVGYAWMRHWLTWLFFYSLIFSLLCRKLWGIR